MSQKPETVFRGKVRRWLSETFPKGWFESIQQVAIGGTPDILGCIAGWFVALELKASEKATVSPLQLLKLERIRAAGGIGLLVYPENWEEVQRKLLALGGQSHGT